MCSRPPQTLNPRADNSCLFLLPITFLAVSIPNLHTWGSGQAPKKCIRAPAAVSGGSPDALLATTYDRRGFFETNDYRAEKGL